YIFDRFYQVNPSVSSPGSGIGLALSKGIIDLHHGEISVTSTVQYGTVFTVDLPRENVFVNDPSVSVVERESAGQSFQEAEVLNEEVIQTESAQPEEAADNSESGTKDCVLIVEDNEELLQILTSLLSPVYKVIIAMNGEEGLKKVMEESPDLVLSDIMMPRMSGTEMCSKIKNNFDLCHIPVVLLTALTSDNRKMEGLQCGADDYIEKPFSNNLLMGHIANLIRNRKILKQKFGQQFSGSEETGNDIQSLALNPIDAEFLFRMEEIIKENIPNPEFDVATLAREMALSRSSLYNKLKALSCMTPNEFILNIRLKYSAVLLKNNPELQITEIAYQSGFNSLRYFRHCFKSAYNITPQEYRNK
ncbi:MAG: hybrid sensor histidine kinase/response regulator transcription factor, partial [Bacteroidales bacterium]